ncbi:MAG: glycosyltransferase family 39 protein [Solirubrobacteraceae bacterium]
MTRLRPQRVALVLVLAFSALLELYRLSQNGWANVYYSAAVKSMLGSLHNFFFVSSDPGGLVSVDKPPVGLWLQTVSAAIFGFHPLSMLVPEALCAIAAVGVMYLIVAPRFGAWAGVAAAAALATFPSFVASGRDNNLDALLILLMALACLTGLRAIETGSWRWLVGTAVLVGLAFNTKTLAAYLIVPGIAIGWMVCAPGSLSRRFRLLAAATVVLAFTSLVWLVAVDATPASQRPYVGGTVDNSELSLSFGHNGFGRVLGERNSPTPDVRVIQAPGSLRLAGALSSSGAAGPLRLFDLPDGDQGAWLLLFALAGLVALALALRGGGRRNPQLALAFVMGGWFAVEAIVLSVSSGIVHPYYVSALGPGTAAMVGAGAAAFVTIGRRGRLLLLLPAAAMIATVGVAVVLLRREHDYLHWFWPVLVGVVGVAIVAMLWQPRVAPAAIAVGLAMLLVVPAIYSATVWQVPVNGTFPTAGPYIEDDTEALSIPTDQIPIFRQLLTYVRARDPGSRWDVLTQGATTAAPLTLLGGRVAALGGYGTIDPVLTPAQLAALVERGEVRFVALGGGYASNGGNAASTAVSRACREIPAPRWRSPQNIDPTGPPVYAYERGGWNLNLFDCTDRTAQLAAQR